MAYQLVALNKLVEQLQRLPGIGGKTAHRLAFHILSSPPQFGKDLASAILNATDVVKNCSVCCSLTDADVCHICSDEKRDRGIICVVSDPKDIAAFERSGEYMGTYHVLHGLISPLDGITAEDLTFKQLLTRVITEEVSEVIMATNGSIEGESTALYVSRLLKPLGVKVTRLAFGVPVGTLLEYADETSLDRALEGRREM